MESQPQNTEFRNNPENFYPCILYLMGHRSDFPTRKNFSSLDDLYLASGIDASEMSKNEIFHPGFNCLPKVGS